VSNVNALKEQQQQKCTLLTFSRNVDKTSVIASAW